MTTRHVNLMHNVLPDPASAGDVHPEQYIVKASGDVWKQNVWIFEDTATRIGLSGSRRIPLDYVGTAKLSVLWSSTGVTGDVEHDFDYRVVRPNNAESMDSTVQESVNLNDTAPATAHDLMENLIDLTSANLVAGAMLEWNFYRDGTDGGETMAAPMILYGLYLQYSDT